MAKAVCPALDQYGLAARPSMFAHTSVHTHTLRDMTLLFRFTLRDMTLLTHLEGYDIAVQVYLEGYDMANTP